MYDLMEQILRLKTPFNMIVVVVLITTGAGVITSIAKQFRKFASQRLELDFKRELLDRGMTVEEIEQVLQAKSEKQPQP
ncbi:MAG: hypothetical protein GXP26_06355 [Planctomycetes bacterium]|nr:hypothetical protein [Planctomycetota bacterium]